MHRGAVDGSVRIPRSTMKRSMDLWMKLTVKIVSFVILAIAIVSGTVGNASAKSCTPGKIITKDCNTCICIDGFGYACTTMACVTGLTCIPGKSFKHYCNVCRCPSNGLAPLAACTKNVCPDGMFNEDGTLNGSSSYPILRDKRQADRPKGTCEPSNSFKYYCNNCRCGTDGLVTSAACTKMGCPEGIFNEDGTMNEPLGQPVARDKRQATCEPGKLFKNYCNSCTCGADGLVASAACTRMECVPGMWNEDGSLRQPLSDPTPTDKRQADGVDATCVAGTRFNYYCNICQCGTDGLRKTAMCTRKGCSDGVYNEDGTLKHPVNDPIPRDRRQVDGAIATCVPGTTFNHYCNTCHCPPNGLRDSAGCTLMGCQEGMWNEDGTLVNPDETPRDKRQAVGAGATCVPGTSFKQYCNTCHCPANGLRDSAACTLIGCQEGMWNEDGTLVNPDETPRDKRQAAGVGATCVPGTSFKQYCNTCGCPANGLRDSAACTLIGCQEGMWNEDGTLVNHDQTPRNKRQVDRAGGTCVPGTSFKQYCNTCRCPANGLRDSAACTLIGCQEGMWNEDGTLANSDPMPRDKRQAYGPGVSTERKNGDNLST